MATTYAGTADLMNFFNLSEDERSALNLSVTQLQDALDRAQTEIDEITNNHFADSGTVSPYYLQITDEKHDGKGSYDRQYFLKRFPLPNLSTVLLSAVSAGATALPVASTNGFLSSGILGVGADKIAYSGKSGSAFTGCTVSPGGSFGGHSANVKAYPYAIEISTTDSGTDPTFTGMEYDVDYDIEFNTGRVHIYRDDIILDILSSNNPPKAIPNRLKATYIWGNDTIPNDIKRLCLMIAAKELLHMTVRKAHLKGLNNFNPEMIGVDENWITRILEEHTNHDAKNT